ncbi:flagellar motor switch protein FliM [Candidatus Poribacteria bacterium]
MNDSLSQEEIDALLNAMSSEETSASSEDDVSTQPLLSQNEIETLLNTVPSPQETTDPDSVLMISSSGAALSRSRNVSMDKYDFTIPSRVSRDHLRALRTLHDSYAQGLSSSLSITLRTVVEVDCVHIEQLTYGEYLSSLLDPSCIGVFNMSPLKGLSIIEINPMLVFPIMDRLLGGSGAARFYNRVFTTIEEMVIMQVMRSALDILEEAWYQNIKLDIKLERLENNPQFIHAAASSDPVILILFDVMLGDIRSMMSLCFPFLTIQQARASLRREESPAFLDDDTIEACRRMIYMHMLNLNMDVSVRYETSRVTLGDLLELQEGDIIGLPDTSGDKARIFVGGQMKFSGKPGMVNGKRAVQLDSENLENNVDEAIIAEISN